MPENVKNLQIGLAADEQELKQFLTEKNISTLGAENGDADVILTSKKTWDK